MPDRCIPDRRRARRVAALALVLVLLVAAGCATPSQADRRAQLVRRAREAIGGYVAALRDGDVATADEHRCRAARVGPDDQEAILGAEAAEVHAALGGLRVASLELVSSIDGVTHVRLQLTGAAGPVYPALVDEGGALRICGASIDGAAELRSSAKTRDGVAETSPVSLGSLVDAAPVAGFVRAPDDALPPGLLDQLPGFVAADGARWDAADGSPRTVSITAVDLDTAAHARAAQQVLEGELQDALTALVPLASPAARGFRYLADYQLFLQPPGAGPVGDYVGFRWGSRIVAIYVVPLDGGVDHAVALAAADAVERAAGVTSVPVAPR